MTDAYGITGGDFAAAFAGDRSFGWDGGDGVYPPGFLTPRMLDQARLAFAPSDPLDRAMLRARSVLMNDTAIRALREQPMAATLTLGRDDPGVRVPDVAYAICGIGFIEDKHGIVPANEMWLLGADGMPCGVIRWVPEDVPPREPPPSIEDTIIWKP